MATNELRSSVVRAASKRQRLTLANRHEADSPKVAKESEAALPFRLAPKRKKPPRALRRRGGFLCRPIGPAGFSPPASRR